MSSLKLCKFLLFIPMNSTPSVSNASVISSIVWTSTSGWMSYFLQDATRSQTEHLSRDTQ